MASQRCLWHLRDTYRVTSRHPLQTSLTPQKLTLSTSDICDTSETNLIYFRHLWHLRGTLLLSTERPPPLLFCQTVTVTQNWLGFLWLLQQLKVLLRALVGVVRVFWAELLPELNYWWNRYSRTHLKLFKCTKHALISEIFQLQMQNLTNHQFLNWLKFFCRTIKLDKNLRQL